MEGRIPDPMRHEGNLNEQFKKFFQNFETYLIATEKDTKPDKVKVALLLNFIGSEGVDLFNTFKFNPETDRQNYAKVVDEFKKYFTPRRNITYERFVFNNRCQGPTETFDQFFSDLKKLVQTCEYDCQEESILIDRIILGTNDRKIQEKLLNMQNITLEIATEQCRNAEATKKQLETVRNSNKDELSVDYVQRKHKFQSEEVNTRSGRLCFKCNLSHRFGECTAFGKQCHKCGKMNHFMKACKAKIKEVKNISHRDESDEPEEELYVHSVTKVGEVIKNRSTIWSEVLIINGEAVLFKVDTGSEVNIISRELFERVCSEGEKKKIVKCSAVLEAFGGMKIKPSGKICIRCRYTDKLVDLEILVVDINVKPIIGLPTCYELGLIKRAQSIVVNNKDKFINDNLDVFEGLGTFQEKCRITLNKDSKPVAMPCRRIPLIIKDRLINTLKNLESKQIIVKVEGASEWVNSLVIIEKPNKSLRLCLDPQALNKCIKREFYEIPSIEDITSKLSGKQYFSVLDFKDGFYQIKLEEESSKLTTFSTPFGYYKFLRLPFGLSLAPEYFQKINYKNFGDIKNTIIYFDDLLIATDSLEEHDKTLKKVIERAREKGIKFNKEKFQFQKSEVKYIGHIFDKNGMRIDQEKIRAINDLKPPKSKKDLQKLLGLVNYVRKFIPNLGEISSSLSSLLKKDIFFQWTEIHDKDLQTIKNEINKNTTLKNFDPNKEIIIHTDASQNGIGCCLMQEGRPVAYGSRGLSDTEKRYAIIEKEMLAIWYAVEKFHNFVYGRPIKIITDHKPNVSIMNKQIAQIHSPRLQRLRLKLIKYDIKIEYLPGKYLYVADYLSRNYSNEKVEEDVEMCEFVHSVEKHLRMSETRKEQFKKLTIEDCNLKKVLEFYEKGWDTKQCNSAELKIYYKLQNDIHVNNNLIFYNDRIVVPIGLRQEMLQLLHEGHFGINRTRDRARQIFFWPGMSNEIGILIKKCEICERYAFANQKEPLISHEIADLPFQKIASDILEYDKNNYLVIVDYLTKWLEIIPLKTKQSLDIINAFKQIFATHGVPDIVISDNMPYFSKECQTFAEKYGFEFKTSSPRYPRSNGLAERFVQVAKNILKKSNDLHAALMEYRNTPITGLKRSPAQLLLGRTLKTKLPVVEIRKPEIKNFKQKLEKRNTTYKKYYDKNLKIRPQLEEGDKVVYRQNKEWQPATVVAKCGVPRSYLIDTGTKTLRRNNFHLRKSNTNRDLDKNSINDAEENYRDNCINESLDENQINGSFIDPGATIIDQAYVKGSDQNIPIQNNNRPQRSIKAPSRFNEYVMY